MQPQSRLGDNSLVPADNHQRVGCPHVCVGPAETGSPNVNVNNQPALRVSDSGVHSQCCGPNTWVAVAGSQTVMINNLPAHRQGDADRHSRRPRLHDPGQPEHAGRRLGLSPRRQDARSRQEKQKRRPCPDRFVLSGSCRAPGLATTAQNGIGVHPWTAGRARRRRLAGRGTGSGRCDARGRRRGGRRTGSRRRGVGRAGSRSGTGAGAGVRSRAARPDIGVGRAAQVGLGRQAPRDPAARA